MGPGTLIGLLMAFADQLKFRNLFVIVIALLLINIIIPDFIPFVDEIILACIAAWLAQKKKALVEDKDPEGVVIEGEIVEPEDEKQGPGAT